MKLKQENFPYSYYTEIGKPTDYPPRLVSLHFIIPRHEMKSCMKITTKTSVVSNQVQVILLKVKGLQKKKLSVELWFVE